MRPVRRAVIAGALAALPVGRLIAAPLLQLSGRYVQGGFAIGRTLPRATYSLDGEVMGKASSEGLFLVGFDRDAKPTAKLKIDAGDGSAEHAFAIAPGDFDIQRIDGLAQDQVTPQGEALLADRSGISGWRNIGQRPAALFWVSQARSRSRAVSGSGGLSTPWTPR